MVLPRISLLPSFEDRNEVGGEGARVRREEGSVQFVTQLVRTLPRSAIKQGISRVSDESEQEPLEQTCIF
jgi:hypothetical protein